MSYNDPAAKVDDLWAGVQLTVTRWEMRAGLWNLSPGQRDEYIRLLNAGVDLTTAKIAAMKYRPESGRERPEPEPLDERYARSNEQRQRESEEWLYGPIPGEGEQPRPEALPKPPSSPAALHPAPKAKGPGGLSRATGAAWKAAKGLTGKPSNSPTRPSRTYGGRRAAHLRRLVADGVYPDLGTAERNVPRRAKRFD